MFLSVVRMELNSLSTVCPICNSLFLGLSFRPITHGYSRRPGLDFRLSQASISSIFVCINIQHSYSTSAYMEGSDIRRAFTFTWPPVVLNETAPKHISCICDHTWRIKLIMILMLITTTRAFWKNGRLMSRIMIHHSLNKEYCSW